MNKIFFAQNTIGVTIPSVTTGVVNTVGTSNLTVDNNELISSGSSTIIEYGTLYTSNQQLALVKDEVGVDCIHTTGSIVDSTTWNDDIINLSDNTTYYYRAYATNAIGNGLGAINNCTTAEIVGTIPTVTTGTVGLTGPTGFYVENNLLVTSGSSIVTEYGLLFSTSSRLVKDGIGVLCTNTIGSLPDNTTWSKSITGLASDRKYYYRAYAENSVGTGCGIVKSQTTLPATTTTTTASPTTYLIKVFYYWVDSHVGPQDGMTGNVYLRQGNNFGTIVCTCSLDEHIYSQQHSFNGDIGTTYTVDLDSINAIIGGNIGTASVCWTDDNFATTCQANWIDNINSACTYEVRVSWGGL